MFHYLFTNDLRISSLESAINEAACCYRDDRVPSASENKNANNNMKTLGFYFNLTKDSNCTKEGAEGNVRKVVLNFIKKFQFPNPRTSASFEECIEDGILLAPMRTILKVLYIMTMCKKEEAFLTKKEILDFIFFNERIAKNPEASVVELAEEIISSRTDEDDATIPEDDVLESEGKYWKHCGRQIREMVKILCWSGCVIEKDSGAIAIKETNLTRDNEADIFEIITCSEYWTPDKSKDFNENKKKYQYYMDISNSDQSYQSNSTKHVSEEKSRVCFKTGIKSSFPMNRIIFGAPGTGKSYTVNKDAKLLIGEDNETDYERVTFHPDYSYANFVGTYKPVMIEKDRQFSMDGDTDYVVSILNDKGKSAQEKYDVLFERFRGDGLTRLPVLLGLYTDEKFKTRKQDGTDTAEDNSVERNHGRAIRKYVNLIDGKEEAGDIAYEYVPGPFMRVYVNALKSARTDNPKPFLLIIEEINRANVAAVFGDIFQLLDRDDDNVSEYPIQASEDIKNYLAKELGGKPKDYTKIRIPDNMFIWATMNSADQGVFPMDTAFKRRWDFTYLGIDDSDHDIRGKYVEVGSSYNKQCIEWNSLRKAINDFLAEEKINEDKQLGPYYVSRDIVVPPDGGNIIDSKRFCDVFKYKVLMYLFEDAAKQKRVKLFSGLNSEVMRYSEICREFDSNGIGIFNSSIQSKVDTKEIVTNNYELDEPGLPNIDE